MASDPLDEPCTCGICQGRGRTRAEHQASPMTFGEYWEGVTYETPYGLAREAWEAGALWMREQAAVGQLPAACIEWRCGHWTRANCVEAAIRSLPLGGDAPAPAAKEEPSDA